MPPSTERLGTSLLPFGAATREETTFLGVFSAMERIQKSYWVGLESGAAEEEMWGFLFHISYSVAVHKRLLTASLFARIECGNRAS